MGLRTNDANNADSALRNPKRRRALVTLAASVLLLILLAGAASWLGYRASGIKDELTNAASLVGPIKQAISKNDPEGAAEAVDRLQAHTGAARELAQDPLWSLASATPALGANLAAVSEVAQTADDVANLGLGPLVKVFDSLDWQNLLPSQGGTDLKPLVQASPSVASAAHVVRVSADRLDQIDESNLLPQVRDPLNQAREELRGVTGALDAASDAAALAPKMLGAESPQNYLLIIQNNAEARASGGIPGALAVLTIDNGKMSLGTQKSASELGSLPTALSVDQEQENIYSSRLGKYIQDVNLTPDFPTAAGTAQAIWEAKTGQRVDGVISIDPVVLSYILQATGPISVDGPEVAPLKSIGLPTQLTGSNVVPTLLSDVYAKIEQPKLQDAYFAGVASEVFSALSSNKGEANGVIEGLTRGSQEGRVLLWSGTPEEQSVISKYPIAGSVTGPSIAPAQFGVYFNDGTGAKMDFYVHRKVQLIKQCPADGYEQTTVRVTSTNTAPGDAARSLPEYVTGGGIFGVAPGVVQTNIVVYGPAQALVENATLNGDPTEFAPYFHASRPVGVVAQQLAPGESKTVEITFGKIVQHAEPNVVVTPSVQNVKDVIDPVENASCG